jgi:hypothetical protein
MHLHLLTMLAFLGTTLAAYSPAVKEDGHDRNEDCQATGSGKYTCSRNKRYTVSFYDNVCYAANFVTVALPRKRLEEGQ